MSKIAILSLLTAILLSGCDNGINYEKMIGDWQVVDFNANTPYVSTEIIEYARIEALTSMYSLKKNKTYSCKSESYFENGTWKLSSDNDSIIFSKFDDKNRIYSSYKLQYVNDESLVFTHEPGNEGTVSMTLEKIN